MSISPLTTNAPPLISIITSTYNAEKHLPDLIGSLRSQERTGIEWIIVDGGSQDNTVALVEDACDVVHKLISEPDRGIYDAWNKGIMAAKGTWIAFIGADDYYLPDSLDICCKEASSVSDDVNMIVGTIHWIDEPDNRIVRTVSTPWDWQKMQQRMTIGHPGSLHHRTLFERFGMFDASLRSAADYDFLLRAGPHIRASFIPIPLARVRIGGASQSPLALREAQLVRRRNLKISNFQAGLAYSIAWIKLAVRSRIERFKSMLFSG
ncbi:glycosyltransferase family 2 protein [Thalassospira xiamenensis]|uniref:Glycosyltransferase n=1 Tax=Thalassospira xiamenensis TaxID=220697 RepID=A0A285TXC2_9PROT|nr:glycosyltransferase family 2 protein [Thalassospira xiamenensis]SOC30125.1 glycosyltransferase [Thalassospira xiamenensis]